MKIEIKKLTPELAEDYACFFDVTPHDVMIGENKCYCVTWRSDDSYAGNGNHWFPTREERRKKAIQFVRAGSLQGYLAYYGERIVGWCNANADCQVCVNYLREYWPIEEYHPEIRVKSIFCFVIAPEMQRMGVATQLLKQVCEDAGADGFDFVEAYVNREHTALDFRGHLAMYETCGQNSGTKSAGIEVWDRKSQRIFIRSHASGALRPTGGEAPAWEDFPKKSTCISFTPLPQVGDAVAGGRMSAKHAICIGKIAVMWKGPNNESDCVQLLHTVSSHH